MKELNCGVYQIRNLINGKLYIGSGRDLRQRKSDHFSTLKNQNHKNAHLQNAYNFYGEENFAFEILGYTDIDHLIPVEDMLIKFFRVYDRNFGYNIRKNADNNLGMKHSEATRKKMSLLQRGENNGNYGKPQSQEAKEKISKSNTGKKRTEEVNKQNSFLHSGSKNPAAKLNEDQVLEIRKMIYEGVHYLTIMENFHLSQTNFYRIKNNKIWKNVIYNPD